MSSFEDRKKSFEKKFAHDQELQFKVSARRNKYLGEWVSQILGYNSDQEKEYIQSVIKADFAFSLSSSILFLISSSDKF